MKDDEPSELNASSQTSDTTEGLYKLLKYQYYFKNKNQDLTIYFNQSADTVYFYYISVLDLALNEPIDDKDYAGYFFLKDLKKEVTFLIKNYWFSWDEDDTNNRIYHLTLTFDITKKQINWFIDKKEYPTYLPEKAILKKFD